MHIFNYSIASLIEQFSRLPSWKYNSNRPWSSPINLSTSFVSPSHANNNYNKISSNGYLFSLELKVDDIFWQHRIFNLWNWIRSFSQYIFFTMYSSCHSIYCFFLLLFCRNLFFNSVSFFISLLLLFIKLLAKLLNYENPF